MWNYHLNYLFFDFDFHAFFPHPSTVLSRIDVADSNYFFPQVRL